VPCVAKFNLSGIRYITVKSWCNRKTCQKSVTMTDLSASAILKEGNTAVITGASSGIGRAAALYCASKGMNVWMADVDAKDLIGARTLVSKEATSSKQVSSVSFRVNALIFNCLSSFIKTRKLRVWWWTCRIRQLSSR
jgi:D-arabinose 1-dehydrogenase-like Zn-dependent alcohol dehydrogenase